MDVLQSVWMSVPIHFVVLVTAVVKWLAVIAAVVVGMARRALADDLNQVSPPLHANGVGCRWNRGIGKAVCLLQVMRGDGVKRGHAQGKVAITV